MFIDIPNVAAVCGSVAFHSFLWFVGVMMLYLLIVIAWLIVSGKESIDFNATDSIPTSFMKAKLPCLAILSFPFLGALQCLGWIMVITFSMWFSLTVLY